MKRLPNEVLLSCINFRVQEHEGLITFTETDPIYGCGTQYIFEKLASCWYVTINSNTGHNRAMFSHLQQAMELVERAYGANFEGLPKCEQPM